MMICCFCKEILGISGLHIMYADGSSTGPHIGYFEPESHAESVELQLEPGEAIERIVGYAHDFIGAIHIKTTKGKTLDAGKNPAGSPFKLQLEGLVIGKISCAISGYISLLRAQFVAMPPPFQPDPQPIPQPVPDIIQPLPPSFPQPYGAPAPYPPSFPIFNVEYTILGGSEKACGTPFDDYKEIVEPTLRVGGKVRITRIKVYEESNGYILGLKVRYELKQADGKPVIVNKEHKSKKVGFFTKRHTYSFPGTDYIAQFQGRYFSNIHKLRFLDNNKKIVLEAGKEEGSSFFALTKRNGPIVAFSGTVSDFLTSLRGYSTF
eukprot:TRINITY_DN6682_c0_g1_i2.p1 TRINITY_DN6682_c0_g1~~TRINITY_DN6682_c0_g1_i2.p1  ORF type:complete len:321 (+),score=29.63 TRINITY_DN6682_c0_g1_i2:83-1045(+)